MIINYEFNLLQYIINVNFATMMNHLVSKEPNHIHNYDGKQLESQNLLVRNAQIFMGTQNRSLSPN
jgi:hypothetical protein